MKEFKQQENIGQCTENPLQCITVYVMRHGCTVWNEKGITQGKTENMLSQKGKIETLGVAEEYKNVKIDAIFCSPRRRAVQTVNIFNKYHNAKVIKDERLSEINQGIFTGRVWDKLSEEEKQLKAKRLPEYGMESYKNVYARTLDFAKDLKSCKYKNILVVTHSTNASMLSEILAGETTDLSNLEYNGCFKNVEIRKFIII